MKKIILITLFLIAPVFADNVAKPTFTSEAIQLTEQLAIVSKKEQEENKEKFYKIDVTYPQIEGKPLSEKEKLFNKLIYNKVELKIKQFKKYLEKDFSHMQTLPEAVRHNTLDIDYDIDVIKPNNKFLVSVRLSAEGMQAGRAHPYHEVEVINYNLFDGKEISFKELFKPGTNYIKFIADYSRKKLENKLADQWMIGEGTKPIAKNFQNWNLEGDDVLITFAEYQVAPYASGLQEVTIPYQDLKKILSTKGLIFSCIEKSCGFTPSPKSYSQSNF